MRQSDEVRRALRFNEQQAALYGRQAVATIAEAIRDAERALSVDSTMDAAYLERSAEWAVEDARQAWRYAQLVQVGREALQEWDRVSA